MRNALHEEQTSEMKELRQQAGAYLRSGREKRKLKQRELSKLVGFDTHTYISALENGHEILPPQRYPAYAEAIKADPAEFARNMLKFYQPSVYVMIWGHTQ